MCASVQAREKLSHCNAAGSVQGLDRISGSVFSAVTIIQAKGKMTMMLQKASKSWATALKVKPQVGLLTARRQVGQWVRTRIDQQLIVHYPRARSFR
jgi:hypothetical protein